jgi:hypothetical protein
VHIRLYRDSSRTLYIHAKAIVATLASDYAGAAPYSAGPAPQPPAESGFWCTANAADYNASYHENNVYVNSDLRYQEVTASTDAYSSTTLTNGFGYAVIFLNGPSPGVTITVKVGSATRSARD